MAKAIIVLIGNPMSTNQVYRNANRGGRCIRYITSKARERKAFYSERAKIHYDKAPMMSDELYMTMKLYFRDKRRRDVDNYNKLILDSLQGICYNDDKQIISLTVTKAYDKENPRAEIVIT